jgi:hypothetical protein
MISKKQIDHIQESWGDLLDRHRWIYTCFKCVMGQEQLTTEGAARSQIYQQSAGYDYKKRRVMRFEAKCRETLEWMGTVHGVEDGNKGPSRHIVYQLSRKFLQGLFANISEFIALKSKQMLMIGKADPQNKKYFDELTNCVDPVRVRELMRIIETTVICDIPQLSFGGSKPHLLASAYDDELTSSPEGHFRFFFVCLAGGPGKECMTLICSKDWRQLYPKEPWACGQRWYCRCEARYKTNNGCLIEIRQGGSYFYMRSDCPDHEILDIRAMAHEKKLGKLTPAQLYEALPSCMPAVTTLVTPDATGKYAHLESLKVYASLPKFAWDTIFQFAASM